MGVGFTGRLTLGKRAMRWSDVADYVRVLRTLSRGDEAVWDDVVIRMIHPDGFVAARPLGCGRQVDMTDRGS